MIICEQDPLSHLIFLPHNDPTLFNPLLAMLKEIRCTNTPYRNRICAYGIPRSLSICPALYDKLSDLIKDVYNTRIERHLEMPKLSWISKPKVRR